MKTRTNDVILMLTGCITPNCNDCLAISDIEQRKAMYIKAIRWYLDNTDYKVVFCENSGTDVSGLFTEWGGEIDRIEFITYKDDSKANKGYKEMEILEHIYTRSRFISEAKESAVLVKITGRLIGLNTNQIVSRIIFLRKKDSPFVSAYLNGRKPWADSRFIFFSLSYFPLLLSCKEKISSTYYFEHAVTESALSAMKSNIRLIYPPLPIRIDGIGGGFGVVYNITDFEYFKQRVKHQLRRILFRIGILPVKKDSRK